MSKIYFLSCATAVALACVLCCTPTLAQKGGGGGGKPGGGGGGDSTSSRYSVLELPFEGWHIILSEPGLAGIVTVAMEAGTGFDDLGFYNYDSAAYVRVNSQTGEVEESGLLPEPPYAEERDPTETDGPSHASDVNVFGEIVGSTHPFEPNEHVLSPLRATLWRDDGDGYYYVLLPNLQGALSSGANSINNSGTIVGGSGNRAVIWNAETLAVTDLNTAATASLGWELLDARDINDDNLIVGMGLLNGSKRGFVMDLDSGTIVAVPLTGSATGNVATEINAAGRVIGTGFVIDGSGYGSNPDYQEGYSWDGPGTAPVALPAVTLNTSEAAGMNDFGATVGNSIIPTDDYIIDTVPTLWDLDTGVFELQSEIPGNSPYTLIRAWDVNNDGWISLYGSRKHKGGYLEPALLLIPNTP